MPELEELFFDLLCNEPAPRHEALVRWVAAYPQFRQELIDFFVTWALSEAFSSCGSGA